MDHLFIFVFTGVLFVILFSILLKAVWVTKKDIKHIHVLDKKFKRYFHISVFIDVVLTVSLSVLFYSGYTKLAESHFSEVQKGTLAFFGSDHYLWSFPAFLLAVVVVYFGNGLLDQLLFRKHLKEYQWYLSRKMGFLYQKLEMPIVLMTLFVSLFLYYFLSNHYLGVHRNHLLYSELYSLKEEVIPIEDIKSMSLYKGYRKPSGRVFHKSTIVLEFKSGKTLKSHDTLFLNDKEEIEGFIEVIQTLTDVPIREFEFLERDFNEVKLK